jgi:hypothetical protein
MIKIIAIVISSIIGFILFMTFFTSTSLVLSQNIIYISIGVMLLLIYFFFSKVLKLIG